MALAVRDDNAIGHGRLVLNPRDLRLAVLLAQRQRIETPRRRSGFVLPELVVHGAVARADELAHPFVPVVTAAEVRTDRAEDHEAHREDVERHFPAPLREEVGTFGAHSLLVCWAEAQSPNVVFALRREVAVLRLVPEFD